LTSTPSQSFSGEQFQLTADANGDTNISLVAGATVSSGETLDITSGQTSSSVTVLSGGTLDVDSGGTADETVISGGVLQVYSGGTASGVVNQRRR